MSRHVYPTLIPLPTELVGERITLRPLRPDDGPAMQAAIDESRTEIEVWMDWPPMMRTRDDAVDYCIRMAAEWLRRDSLNVGVFETATGRYLGGTGFHTISWRLRSVLVHEYLEVDLDQVRAAMPLARNGYRRYVRQAAAFVAGLPG